MKHIPSRLALIAGLVLMASVITDQNAQAQIPVFGNFNFPKASDSGANLSSPSLFWSNRFFTGSKDVTVDSVDATLARITPLASVSIDIYSNDVNSNPGDLLFSFGTQSVTNLFGGGTALDYTFAPGGSFTLLAGTTYHLVGRSEGAAAWVFTDPITGVTPTAFNGSEIGFSTALVTQNSGATWTELTDVPMRFQLNGPAAVAVPEANTFALALPALAMVGAVVIAKRRKSA